MITRENLPFILAELEKEEIQLIKDTEASYLILEVATFNAGSTVDIDFTNDLPANIDDITADGTVCFLPMDCYLFDIVDNL